MAVFLFFSERLVHQLSGGKLDLLTLVFSESSSLLSFLTVCVVGDRQAFRTLK